MALVPVARFEAEDNDVEEFDDDGDWDELDDPEELDDDDLDDWDDDFDEDELDADEFGAEKPAAGEEEDKG